MSQNDGRIERRWTAEESPGRRSTTLQAIADGMHSAAREKSVNKRGAKSRPSAKAGQRDASRLGLNRPKGK